MLIISEEMVISISRNRSISSNLLKVVLLVVAVRIWVAFNNRRRLIRKMLIEQEIFFSVVDVFLS